MFNVIVKCFSRITKKESREIKLLLLGLDNAGKSTIINDLKGEPKEDTVPTVGFSSAEFKLLNFKVTAYDVGGGPRIRGIWKDYYAEIFGMVYVVDASDHDRIADSRTVLREALSDSRLAGKPFVVFANKQDIDGALSEQDIEAHFELEQLANKCESRYKVYQCTALLNGGRKIDVQLKKGLNWLLQAMKDDFVALQDRVHREVEVQKEAEKKARQERMERVRKNREERERAEREKEVVKNNEDIDSDDEDIVFGNALPRVKDTSKTKKKNKKDIQKVEGINRENETVERLESPVDREQDSNAIGEASLTNPNELHHDDNHETKPEPRKRRKKKKAKRNQTAPSDEGENSGDLGIVLKPVAWKTPPASLNGFPGNGRKLEPLRAPLHNNLYSRPNVGHVSDEEDKYNNGHIRTLRARPNEEENTVIT